MREGIGQEIEIADVMGLRVAKLALWLDAEGAGLRLTAPPGHVKFLQPQTSEVWQTSEVSASLTLRVRDDPLPRDRIGRDPLCLTEIWELWRDEVGRYVFVAPRQSPPRWVVIDADFTAGEVFGDFSSSDGEGLYPLKSLDIRLYANWLAEYGDVILHAAGVAVDGRGHCFAGSAGVGKSTLAASVKSTSREAAEAATTNIGTAPGAAPGGTRGAVVLGEDQVILRFLEDRFWIYGTPWHLDPAMCAPIGVPLEKLFFLDRAAGSGVHPLKPADGVSRLLQTAFIPYYRPQAVATILDRLAVLAEQVPFYTLSYELGADVTGLISDA